MNQHPGPLVLACFGGLGSGISTLVYCTTTLALNIILTSLIVLRLWQCKVQLQNTLGVDHGKHYSVLSTVFIESACLNAVCSVLLLASSVDGIEMGTDSVMPLLFDVWAAITPAIQASFLCPLPVRSHPYLFPSLAAFFPGLLKLPHHL